jgi:hypothetical protein
MRAKVLLLGAAALAVAPAIASAQTAPPGQGQYNGQNYWHSNSPPVTTGQPGASCEQTGTPPGNSSDAPGSAFADGGTAGSKYAGEQAQNARNTSSVSQYDVACTHQPG